VDNRGTKLKARFIHRKQTGCPPPFAPIEVIQAIEREIKKRVVGISTGTITVIIL
jgi:hypothetical protein